MGDTQPDSSTAPGGIAGDIDRILEQAETLRQLASDGEGEPSDARNYDFSIRWGALLTGRLERLRYYHARGELDIEQRDSYEHLESVLRDITPLAERLGLPTPT